MAQTQRSCSQCLNVLLLGALGIMLIVVILSLLGQYVVSPSVKTDTLRIKAELPAAKARWQAHNVTDYNIDINGGRPFDLVCFQNVTISVRNGKLADVYNSCCSGCSYDSMTVEQMFTTIEKHLENLNPQETYLTATFDPEWGFVTEYSYGCTRVSTDCGEWFKFSNFKVIK